MTPPILSFPVDIICSPDVSKYCTIDKQPELPGSFHCFSDQGASSVHRETGMTLGSEITSAVPRVVEEFRRLKLDKVFEEELMRKSGG
jgi:hypothetical protein